MPRKPNIQKVSSSVRRSVEKFSGDIESLSSQIAGLTDAIISEKNLAASKIKSERELLARKNALQNIKEDIDDLRSERRKNQDKLDRLISDQEKEAEKEKQDNRKEQNYYKDAATNAYKSGKFVSGLIFEFLGRNEKDKKQIEAERKADRQDQIQELRNRSKELSEQTKSLKDIRNNISVLNTNIVNAEEERMYVQRDAEKPVSDISKFASVKLLDIEPEALSKLEKIISKSKAADGGGLSLTDAIGSSAILKKTLEAFSKIGPLLQAISQGGLGTTLLAITGGLAGAAASWSLFFKGLNDDQKAYNKRRETEEEDRKRVAEAKTKREDTQARSEVKQQIDAIQAGGQTATPEVIENAAEQMLRDTTGTKNEIERRRKLALALRERAKQMREETSPLAAEVPPPVEMQPQNIGIKGTSEALAYDYAPTPTKLNLAEVPTIKSPTVTPKKVVPIITPPKAGAKPAAQVESSFTDNILGKIGSFLPTGVGSLIPTAEASTNISNIPRTAPIIPTKSPIKIISAKEKVDYNSIQSRLKELGPEFLISAQKLASKYNVRVEDLLANMYAESRLDPKAINPKGGASGLIQFMPETAKGLGTSVEEIRNMSAIDQLKYVEKYFDQFGLEKLGKVQKEKGQTVSASSLYSTVFLPKFKEAPENTIFGVKDSQELLPGTKLSMGKIYEQNASLDLNKDGKITKEELGTKIGKYSDLISSAISSPSYSTPNFVPSNVNNIYTAAANNKAMQQQTQGNNVVAVNNNVVTNNQTTMPNVRPRPEEPYNPLKLLYNLYPTI